MSNRPCGLNCLPSGRWVSPILRRIARGLLAAALVALPSLMIGCQANPSGDEPVDDEAMVRARAEGKTPAQAAVDYFRPKTIVDYFPKMDAVGLPADGTSDFPDQLSDLVAEKAPGGRRPDRTVAPLKLNEQEAFGRNAWMIWCAGNEAYWDWLSNNSFGGIDLLKLVDSRNRSTLFRDAGLINEPEMTATGMPEETDLGVWLNVPSRGDLRDARKAYLKKAFALDEAGKTTPTAYGYGNGPPAAGKPAPAPAEVAKDAYGSDENPPPQIYGLSSGVIGLRIFPNPKFDADARDAWDPKRYYSDPDYYNNPRLVRPFRVGMSCSFCHASFHPLNPPRDVTDPAWENISGNIGAQYFRFRAVFGNLLKPESFVYHVLDSQPPGSLDTSFLPSDNINNPNAMNPIFGLADRLKLAARNPKETLGPDAAVLPSAWTPAEVAQGKVPKAFLDANGAPILPNENPRSVPRVLLDGADSIGAFGSLARVYLNIGSYYEQWIRLHNTLVGFRPQRPFLIADCKAHSVYWNATEYRVGPMRDYFVRITPPMRLVDAKPQAELMAPLELDAKEVRSEAGVSGKGPEETLAIERTRRVDVSKLKHGREVFARNCIVCHSSVQEPRRVEEMANYATRGEFWDHDPGRWVSDPDYLKWALAAVETPDFWLGNYLSTDYRVPITLVGTNSARAMATNGMDGHMWSDFSSASYQKLPSVGSIDYFNPFLGEDGGDDSYEPRHNAPDGLPGGGGPGFYRPPTLISIWATAPILHNNSLGIFNNDPSVDGRLAAFDDAIRKLLWPERRALSSSYNGATPERLVADHGLIWRTPVETYLTLAARQVPAVLGSQLNVLPWVLDRFPWLEHLAWLAVPAGLIALSFVVLRLTPRGTVRLLGGYVPLVLGLVLGFLIAYLNGRLGDLRVGPIPQGTPVNLLANLNPDADPGEAKRAINLTLRTLAEADSSRLDDADKLALIREKVAPALMSVSRCPDFVMDKGHAYEWFKSMTDADKDALIELLKTF